MDTLGDELVSHGPGAALVLDYVLTISISIASGVDALFSLLPLAWQTWKLAAALAVVAVLLVLNLRGMREAIKVLLPIFLGFVVTHAWLILYGVLDHLPRLTTLVPQTVGATPAATDLYTLYDAMLDALLGAK